MSKRIVTFGEIMLRLAPPGYLRFTQANCFEAVYGGGEANVAVTLANFGMDAAFVTLLPKNPIGDCAVNELRKYGVDSRSIVRGGGRIGIYFYERGASQRPSKVIYDRAQSSISEAVPGDFNWPEILRGADWFHFTGITPALSDSAAAVTLEAARTAKEMGLTVSCDLNFRKKLWSTEKAGKVMGTLMETVDLCIANEEDAELVFGIKAPETDVAAGTLNQEGYRYVARELCSRFSLKLAAITLRESFSAFDNNWSAMISDGETAYFSRKYALHIVDRVGGGDSFGGGLIYSLLMGKGHPEALEFAVAASALKHSIEGDANLVTAAEVQELLNSGGSGRVQR